ASTPERRGWEPRTSGRRTRPSSPAAPGRSCPFGAWTDGRSATGAPARSRGGSSRPSGPTLPFTALDSLCPRVLPREEPAGHEEADADEHHPEHGNRARRAEEGGGGHERREEADHLEQAAEEVAQPRERHALRPRTRLQPCPHCLFQPVRPNQRLTSSRGRRTRVGRPCGQSVGWAVRKRSRTIAAMLSRPSACPARTAEWQASVAARRSRRPATVQSLAPPPWGSPA